MKNSRLQGRPVRSGQESAGRFRAGHVDSWGDDCDVYGSCGILGPNDPLEGDGDLTLSWHDRSAPDGDGRNRRLAVFH